MASKRRASTSKTNWEVLWENLFEEVEKVEVEKSKDDKRKTFIVEIAEFKRIKSILNLLAKSQDGAIPDITEKCSEKTHSCWNRANDHVFNSDTNGFSMDGCFEEFTKSIAVSQNGSKDLAKSYAKRSTVSCSANLIEDCLKDIDRAFEIGLPDEIMAQIFYRISKCRKAQDPEDPRIEEALTQMRIYMEKMNIRDREKLIMLEKKDKDRVLTDDSAFYKWNMRKTCPILQDQNPMIPGLSNAVELKYDPKYGRHMVATRDIRPGEFLAVQKPYARIPQWQNRYKICWFCSRKAWSSIPCENCADVIFCSKKCRDRANVQHHDIECPVIRAMIALKLHDKLFLCLRLFVKGFKQMGNSLTALKDIVEEIDSEEDHLTRGFTDNVMDPENFSTIYGFTKNDGDDEFSCQSILLAYLLAAKTDIFGGKLNMNLDALKVNKKFIFVARILEKLLILATTNSSEDVLYDKVNTMIRVTHSIVPAHNFFNHRCFPSASAGYHSDFRVCRSITSIKKGEQIFYTYGDNAYYLKSRIERMRYLYKSYHFVCDCSACENKWSKCPTLVNPESLVKMYGPMTNTGINIPKELVRIHNNWESITENYYEEKENRQPIVSRHVQKLREIIEFLTPNSDTHNWYLLCAQLYLERFFQILENRYISPDQYF